jgi:hypothetical protein
VTDWNREWLVAARIRLDQIAQPAAVTKGNAAVDATFPTDKSVGEIPRSR